MREREVDEVSEESAVPDSGPGPADDRRPLSAGQVFDRPLRGDRLLRVWSSALLVSAVCTVAFSSGSGDLDREAAGRALDLLAGTALLTFLVVCLPLALCRRRLRAGRSLPWPVRLALRAWARSRCGRWWSTRQQRDRRAGAPVLFAEVNGWTTGFARRSSVGPSTLRGSRRSDRASRWPARGDAWLHAVDQEPEEVVRVPELTVWLSAYATAVGVPVEVSWDAPGADSVQVSGLQERCPPRGSRMLDLDRTGPVVVTAVNGVGQRVVRTGLVRVLPVPRIDAVRVPAMAPVSLSAHVDVSVGVGEPVLARVDRVLQDQALRRQERELPPLHLPVSAPVAAALASLGAAASSLRGWRTGSRGPECEDVVPHRAPAAAVLSAALQVLRSLRPTPRARAAPPDAPGHVAPPPPPAGAPHVAVLPRPVPQPVPTPPGRSSPSKTWWTP